MRRSVGAAVLVLGMLAAAGRPALAAPAGALHLPDLQTIIPDAFSIVQTAGGREFRYTHLVYNAGPGPLEIQPEYVPSAGTYLGTQQSFTHDAAGNWSLAATARVADQFYFHAPHGHFHYPLASFGLYAVAPDGSPGAPVALSPKNGFCIADSYIYDGTIEHGGAFVGSQGSCADPNSLRGISVGGADEYDYRDPGQAIPIGSLPDGSYWFRAITDPYDDLDEADEANNETDVRVTIANGQVTAGEVRHPDTTPPAVALAAPAAGARLAGAVVLSATSPVTGAGAVEFLVDGTPVGTSPASGSPFAFTWDSTTVVDGEHWVVARAHDAAGRIGTSAVTVVAVDNGGGSSGGGPFGVEAIASQDGAGAVSVTGLTTSVAGDLLLALVASDGPAASGQQLTVSGAGVPWSLVRRANGQFGVAEVWSARAAGALANATVTSTPALPGFRQSMTVVAFSGAAGVGASSASSAASGAPTTSITSVADGSLVFGVGNDWDGGMPRTLGPDQVMRHQWLDSAVGTFWMQSHVTPTPAPGTLVVTNATAPVDHRWNLASVEILAAAPSADDQPPLVAITDPKPGATVSGIVTLGAAAADNVGVTSLEFTIDGQPMAVVTSPPYAAQWDTRGASAGGHAVAAIAADAAGNQSTSSPVLVNVDNSAPPPALMSVDAKVSQRGSGTLAAPALTTTLPGGLVVAFVSYDGPGAPGSQSATVAGGGLAWTLVKRSNTQPGVSEVWAAKADGVLSGAVVTATPLVNGYDGMLTVVAFANAKEAGVAAATGAPSGPPDVYLPGVEPGSWCFAAGNDWDGAVGRTPVAGQILQEQWIDAQAGDTFWVQSTLAPTPMLSLVTIHDDAPTTNRWNYAAVELRASPQGECNNGLDDDGDGLIDTADAACSSGVPAIRDPSAPRERTLCQNGLDDDGDGRIDFDGGQSLFGVCSGGTCPPGVSDADHDGVADPDPNCAGRPWWNREASSSCGLGAELAGLLPALAALRRFPRRRRLSAGGAARGRSGAATSRRSR